jgi:hypothetical protein
VLRMNSTAYFDPHRFVCLMTYLYEIPEGACLWYLILQTFCLILHISSRNPGFTRSILRICTEGEVPRVRIERHRVSLAD